MSETDPKKSSAIPTSMDSVETIDGIYKSLLQRTPAPAERLAVLEAVNKGKFTLEEFAVITTFQAEFLVKSLANAQRFHLHSLHSARTKLISHFLPPGKRILDVGGANGSMLEYGYAHPFDELILTDIPPDERIPELRDIDLTERWAHAGDVRVLYTSLTDLSTLAADYLDLVWVGQVVEHITEDDFKTALREIHRVLRPGGYFCFDTPNAILTRIHCPHQLIHPEHKKEYRPEELRKLVLAAGFKIEEELGITPMPRTYRTSVFSYEEMVLNSGFSRDLDSSYLIYFCCSKADLPDPSL